MNRIVIKLKQISIFDWECIMLCLAAFLVPFHNSHEFLNLRFMGDMGNKLSIYPIILGICFFLYRIIKEKNKYFPKSYIVFLGVFFLWQLISLVHGLIIFPVWQEISASQFKKLEGILALLSTKGISVNPLLIGQIWWSTKILISHVLGYCVTYGAALWVISLFYQNRKQAIQAFQRGILGGAIICSLYFIFELLYLFGSYDAMAVLAHINPMIYDVGSIHGWWPPLFGGNRVRSVFAEPAYMALYLTVTIPTLFFQIHNAKKNKWIWKLLLFLQLIMMWGTNSKTAMGIMIAECMATLVFLFLRRERIVMKNVLYSFIIIVVICGVGIQCNKIFQHRYAVSYNLISIEDNNIVLKITNKSKILWNKETGIVLNGSWYTDDWKDEGGQIKVPLTKTLFPGQSQEMVIKLPGTIDKNIYSNLVFDLEIDNQWVKNQKLYGEGSGNFALYWNKDQWSDKGEATPQENKMTALTSKTEGSNQQRYGLMYVESLIGLDHLIFGVGGQELKQAYIPAYVPDWLKKNKEINLWLSYQKTKGAFNLGFPILSDYTHQFSSYGLPGLIFYLTPSVYTLFLLIKKRKYWLGTNNTEYSTIAILIVSFFGMMVAFIGCNSFELYIYWILLGVSLGYIGTINQTQDV